MFIIHISLHYPFSSFQIVSFFSFTLHCYLLHFSALFFLSVILCIVSYLAEFCYLYGLGFDCDTYEVVAEQMIDESALGNDRVFTNFAYYHTHCVLELYPRYLIKNKAKAASASIRPTVDDFDREVSSSGVVVSP